MKHEEIEEGMVLYSKELKDWVIIEFDYYKHDQDKGLGARFGVSSFVPSYDSICELDDLSLTDPHGNTEPPEEDIKRRDKYEKSRDEVTKFAFDSLDSMVKL